MPINEIMTVAALLLAGIIATHPLTWRTEVRKVQVAILRDVADTRSWGNPSLSGGRGSWTSPRRSRAYAAKASSMPSNLAIGTSVFLGPSSRSSTSPRSARNFTSE